jgi:hypothetical protein
MESVDSTRLLLEFKYHNVPSLTKYDIPLVLSMYPILPSTLDITLLLINIKMPQLSLVDTAMGWNTHD